MSKLLRMFWPWVLFTMALLSIGVPIYLSLHRFKPDAIGAYGSWFGDAIVALAAIFAIQQLLVNKTSVDTDTFLKICAIIDDEDTFGKNYALVRGNSERLRKATYSSRNGLQIPGGGHADRLDDAAMDVLYALEQIGILVAFTDVNRNMVDEYIGDVVINSYDALHTIVEAYQREDKTMFQRFVALHALFKTNWNRGVLAHLPYTNVR